MTITDTIRRVRKAINDRPGAIQATLNIETVKTLLDAAEKAEQWRQMCESVQQTNLALINKAERYEKALNGALGYLRNARIDLETGAPKRTALNTIGGGIAMVESALAVGKDGA